MKRTAALAACLGLIGAAAAILLVGLGPVTAAVSKLGWRALITLLVLSPLPLGLLASAWSALEKPWRRERLIGYAWARAVREAAGELLPFSHLGGVLIGARAAIFEGFGAGWSFASIVVDVTTEMVAQLGFTAIGVGLLLTRLDPGIGRHRPLTIGFAGLVLSAAAVIAFILLQNRGMGFVTRLIRRLLPVAAAGAAETEQRIGEIYQRPGRFSLAVCLHLLAWCASALCVWLALKVAGVPVGALAVLGLEALVMAMRSAAVIAPMGLGVQEGAYAVLGPLFGLRPEIALAISLIKRARDITAGAPVLLIWQAREGRRFVRGAVRGVD